MSEQFLINAKHNLAILVMIVLLTSCGSVVEQSEVENLIAYEGYTGEYEGLTLVLDERFNQYNYKIWAKGDGAVGTESACRFQPESVIVQDGNLQLKIEHKQIKPSWSNDHQAMKPAYQFSCGELRLRADNKIRYGRFETRMKAPHRNGASGYISSFFTYTHEGEPKEWEEIDVELEGGRPDKFQANLIYGLDAGNWWGTRKWGAWEDKISIGAVDEWRVYAIEWTPNSIKWFVDGKLYKTLDVNDLDCLPSCKNEQKLATPIPDNLTQLMMNFWIPNDQIQDVFGGNKSRNVYPMTTTYDWVRVYQLDAYPINPFSL